MVIDKQQYHEKALSLLNEKSTYSVLSSDPTSKTQTKLNKMLLDLKKANRLNMSTVCTKCYTVVMDCALILWLAKNPQDRNSFETNIVSFVNFLTYLVLSYLGKILSPVVGNTENTVKNSSEFRKTLGAEDLLVHSMLLPSAPNF